MTAIGALIGVLASLVFPLLRTKLGLKFSGQIGFMSQAAALSLCVASIWMPGAPYMNNEMNQTSSLALSIKQTEIQMSYWQIYGSLTLLMIGIMSSSFGKYSSSNIYDMPKEVDHVILT